MTGSNSDKEKGGENQRDKEGAVSERGGEVNCSVVVGGRAEVCVCKVLIFIETYAPRQMNRCENTF